LVRISFSALFLETNHLANRRVQTYSHHDKNFEEQEFAMWQFKPVIKNDDSDGEDNVVDEHEQWLVRMTNLIGIDYLGELPPWHLLDVERDASKGDVKSRFRELSRSFHPDKLLAHQSDKKELFERIFVLLQNAYQGLKSADEAEKEEFKIKAESSSQLFAYSQSVVELLPFHWSKLDNGGGRYILNVASQIKSTSLNSTSAEEDEFDPSVQLWVTFMYSARCGMSRSIVGMLDLAARHLEQHENIKVGSYGCGIYREYPPIGNDPTGVLSDPICSQFRRRETPNVHLIVETIPGRKRDKNGDLVEYFPDLDVAKENARFKHFYADVPSGNITQFFPHNMIDFAKAAKMVWQNNRLVHKMTLKDFSTPLFIDSVSIVAYLDGTENGETNDDNGKSNVVDAILSSLPGVARRFLNDNFYVGVALCGFGDEENIDMNDEDSNAHVDCSKLSVSWLPDIKVYANNDTTGVSLLRGEFSDMRDVQIALESMGNTIRMLLGGTDDYEDDIKEMQDIVTEEGGGNCQNQQPPPPEHYYDQELVKTDGRMEETHFLEAGDSSDQIKPALKADNAPRIPKLASADNRPLLVGERDVEITRNRISGFHKRETKTAGAGALLGGGSGGNAGLIA
jgi:curved DNA-binding protein CbpA